MHPELREQFAMVNCLRITKWQIVDTIFQKVNCLRNLFFNLNERRIHVKYDCDLLSFVGKMNK